MNVFRWVVGVSRIIKLGDLQDDLTSSFKRKMGTTKFSKEKANQLNRSGDSLGRDIKWGCFTHPNQSFQGVAFVGENILFIWQCMISLSFTVQIQEHTHTRSPLHVPCLLLSCKQWPIQQQFCRIINPLDDGYIAEGALGREQENFPSQNGGARILSEIISLCGGGHRSQWGKKEWVDNQMPSNWDNRTIMVNNQRRRTTTTTELTP